MEEMRRKLSRSERVPANKIPAFFKPFVAQDREQRLKIPFAFSEYMEGMMPCVASLRDRNRNLWQVKIAQRGDQFCFEGGWAEFVEKNNVQFGDFLVFQYDGNSFFDFKLLGTTACEKEVKIRVSDLNIKEEDKKEEEEYAEINDDEDEDFMKEEEEEEEEEDDDDDDDDDDNDNDNYNDEDIDYYDDDDDDDAGGDAADDEGDVDDDDDDVHDDDDDDDDDDEGDDQELRDFNNGEQKTNGACMVGYGRRSHDDINGEENAIFESGQVDRPKVNAYFVAKINPFRLSGLYVPIEVMKDFNLELPDMMVIRDEEGRTWTTKVKVWKDGRTWLSKGWKAFCKWNKVQQGDRCFCEFVPQNDGKDHFLQIRIVRAGTWLRRK